LRGRVAEKISNHPGRARSFFLFLLPFSPLLFFISSLERRNGGKFVYAATPAQIEHAKNATSECKLVRAPSQRRS